MKRRGGLTALALAVLLAACGGGSDTRTGPGTPSSTTTPATTATRGGGADCSAAGLNEDVSEPAGLPDAVATMRKEILNAAVRCDYELLEALALRGAVGFQYSFGQQSPEGAAEFWREHEREGDPVLATMVKLLALPYATTEVGQDERPADRGAKRHYFWPSAHGERPSEADWDELESVYPAAKVEEFRRHGSYLGYRLAITGKGDWVYFVAGD